MPPPLDANRICELHVHIGGCFYAEDLIRFGRGVFEQVDWTSFCDRYEHAYGEGPDLARLYRNALSGSPGGADGFCRHFCKNKVAELFEVFDREQTFRVLELVIDDGMPVRMTVADGERT